MKTSTRILVAVLLATVLMGNGLAQKNSIKDVTTNKYALQNLVAGIHSDNTGLKEVQSTLLVNTE